MGAREIAREALDVMLGYLGFIVRIDDDPESEDGLQLSSEEGDLLIGRRGERLEDMQYLTNRIVASQLSDAPRVKIDIGHYRQMRDDRLLQKVQHLAERVRATGKPMHSEPLNAYHRRMVHQAYEDDPGIETQSPKDSERLKRITLRRSQK